MHRNKNVQPKQNDLSLLLCVHQYTRTCRKEKTRKTTQAAKHSLHQLRKRRSIGPKRRESPPMKGKKIAGIWRVAGSPLLQTETFKAIVRIMHRDVDQARQSVLDLVVGYTKRTSAFTVNSAILRLKDLSRFTTINS